MQRITRPTVVLLLLSIQFATTLAGQDTCHALALSGGANKGAYEVGALWSMAHLLDASELSYDVVTGVSAGALNLGGISIFPIGQEREMSEWLVNLWETMTSDQVFEEWPLGIVGALFTESGVLNDDPLLKFVTKILDNSKGIFRRLVISAVDVNTGSYVTFNESIPFVDLPTAVISSSSLPFVFPHRHFQNRILMDGGTVWNTNMISAIDRCMELVDDESKIVVDIIICENAKLGPANNTGNSIDNYLRYSAIKSYHKTLNDVLEFQRSRPNVNYRYMFVATKPLTSGLNEMKFDNATISPMIQIGKEDAARVITLGEGKVFEMLTEWDETLALRQKYPYFEEYLEDCFNNL